MRHALRVIAGMLEAVFFANYFHDKATCKCDNCGGMC